MSLAGMIPDPHSRANQAFLAAAASGAASMTAAFAALAGMDIPLLITGGAGTIASALCMALARYWKRRSSQLEEWLRRAGMGEIEPWPEQKGDEIDRLAEAAGALRDGTARAGQLGLVQQELQQRNDLLEQVLEKLRNTQDQIVSQQKLAELGEITSLAAHEIRNPLQFVFNFAESSGELLNQLIQVIPEDGASMDQERLSLYREISDQLQENMEYITKHGARVNQVVQRMMEAGQNSSEEFEERDINALLRRCSDTARRKNEADGLEVEENMDPNMGEIRMIPSDLGQAMTNIIDNAIYAVMERRRDEPGFQPAIMLETRTRRANAEVRIWDNGPGMRNEIIDRAMTPFFTTKPANQGAGLGLSVANDIVREHLGTLLVESVPGNYTVVTISIPNGHTPAEDGEAAWE